MEVVLGCRRYNSLCREYNISCLLTLNDAKFELSSFGVTFEQYDSGGSGVALSQQGKFS